MKRICVELLLKELTTKNRKTNRVEDKVEDKVEELRLVRSSYNCNVKKIMRGDDNTFKKVLVKSKRTVEDVQKHVIRKKT